MRWAVLWVLLVVAAGVFYGWLGLRLWRKGRALARELSAAADTLAVTGDVLAQAASLSAELQHKDPGQSVAIEYGTAIPDG